MITLRTLTMAAALVVGATSLAVAQNGLPTGNEHPVAGGAAGGPANSGTTQKSKSMKHGQSSDLSTLILAQNQPNTGAAGKSGGDTYGQPYSGTAGARENSGGH
jgi:hypothetical protein